MPPQWRLGDVMRLIAVIAIYLSAFRLATQEPSDDPLTAWTQLVANFLLFLVMPFHVMWAWARLTAGKAGEQGDRAR